MGVIEKILYEKTLTDSADRSPNLLRVYQSPNRELVIHYRNLKIVLLTAEDRFEWIHGFKTALENLGNHFKEDI